MAGCHGRGPDATWDGVPVAVGRVSRLSHLNFSETASSGNRPWRMPEQVGVFHRRLIWAFVRRLLAGLAVRGMPRARRGYPRCRMSHWRLTEGWLHPPHLQHDVVEAAAITVDHGEGPVPERTRAQGRGGADITADVDEVLAGGAAADLGLDLRHAGQGGGCQRRLWCAVAGWVRRGGSRRRWFQLRTGGCCGGRGRRRHARLCHGQGRAVRRQDHRSQPLLARRSSMRCSACARMMPRWI